MVPGALCGAPPVVGGFGVTCAAALFPSLWGGKTLVDDSLAVGVPVEACRSLF